MLKYEHVSGIGGDFIVYLNTGGAYRVTIMYDIFLPDIRYVYNSHIHRADGPACIDLSSGVVKFLVNGTHCLYTETFCQTAGMSGEETLMWVLRFGDRLPTTIEGFYGEGWKDMSLDEF